MAAIEANKNVIWMKNLIEELGIREEEFRLHYDSQSSGGHADQGVASGDARCVHETNQNGKSSHAE